MAKRANFTLDPQRVTLIATGKVAPVLVWNENAPKGSVRPQQVDEPTGLPLWVVDCLDDSDEDAQRASVVGVRVAAAIKPEPQRYTPLSLDAVSVTVYIDRAGNLVQSFQGTLTAPAARAAA